MVVFTGRKIAYFLLCLLLLWLTLIGGVYLFQEAIIFQGQILPEDYAFELGGDFEELDLNPPGTARLHALYFRSPFPSRGAILYLHGNADNLQRWGQYQGELTRRGYDVLMIDYRGYGKSRGEIGTEACYRDARRAYDWLAERFAPDRITLYGRSLGTSIAAELASRVAAQRLILETPFDNLRHSLELTIPALWLPWPLRHPFAVDRYLPQIDCPITIFHGTRDWVVRYRSARALQPLLGERDRFYTIPGGGHRNLADYAVFQEGLDEVLGKGFD